MKKSIHTIKGFEYDNQKQFEKDIKVMREKHYILMDDVEGFKPYETMDGKIVAYYSKDTL